jgi:hypothetical protein
VPRRSPESFFARYSWQSDGADRLDFVAFPLEEGPLLVVSAAHLVRNYRHTNDSKTDVRVARIHNRGNRPPKHVRTGRGNGPPFLQPAIATTESRRAVEHIDADAIANDSARALRRAARGRSIVAEPFADQNIVDYRFACEIPSGALIVSLCSLTAAAAARQRRSVCILNGGRDDWVASSDFNRGAMVGVLIAELGQRIGGSAAVRIRLRTTARVGA